MRIKLKKPFTPHHRELDKGTEMRVSRQLGKKLIKDKIAVEIDHITKEEIETLDASIDELEKETVKKVTKEKKDKN